MKKRIFGLLMFTCMFQCVMAQPNSSEQRPSLVTEGKQWAVYHSNPFCSVHRPGTVTYQLRGDTVISGKAYKKEWQSLKEDLSDMHPTKCYMREEDGRVYRLDGQGEELWFDYNAQLGDTLALGRAYGRVISIYDALLAETDSCQTYKCFELQLGYVSDTTGLVKFKDRSVKVCEVLGVVNSYKGSYGLCEHVFDAYQCQYTLLCVHDNNELLYQTHDGCYKEYSYEKPRPTTKHGYGIYYGDSYLYRYIINEGEAVTDSTDFARWNDKTVIYFDVDTVGTSAFTNAIFRQGQILYFTERLNCIMPDAFTDIMMLDDEQAEENPFGDLCIVFNGSAPSIDKSSISNYADTTYHITYVVPDLAAYIKDDIQWTYSQLVTIDDFVRGYISPENEVAVNNSTETDVNLQPDTNQDGNIALVVHTRPRKDIPVRIGEGENKDIYSRAPAWMRYTIELRITDTEGTELYAGEMQCSAYGECQFNVSFACPANNIIYIYSRSIDMFGRATEWSKERINLKEYEYEGDYVTDANVDLNNTADADGLTATIGTDSIRITGYYSSNCDGGLYCAAIARGNNIELIFHDGATANCIDFHHVDFMIPRFSDEIKRIDVIEPYPLEVTINNVSSVTDIDNPVTDAPYYDLQGRPVANPTRGIYIKDGRKVVL